MSGDTAVLRRDIVHLSEAAVDGTDLGHLHVLADVEWTGRGSGERHSGKDKVNVEYTIADTPDRVDKYTGEIVDMSEWQTVEARIDYVPTGVGTQVGHAVTMKKSVQALKGSPALDGDLEETLRQLALTVAAAYLHALGYTVTVEPEPHWAADGQRVGLLSAFTFTERAARFAAAVNGRPYMSGRRPTQSQRREIRDQLQAAIDTGEETRDDNRRFEA